MNKLNIDDFYGKRILVEEVYGQIVEDEIVEITKDEEYCKLRILGWRRVTDILPKIRIV